MLSWRLESRSVHCLFAGGSCSAKPVRAAVPDINIVQEHRTGTASRASDAMLCDSLALTDALSVHWRCVEVASSPRCVVQIEREAPLSGQR